jgi:hypothetical protein
MVLIASPDASRVRGIIDRSVRARIERGMHALRRSIAGKVSGIVAICAMLLLSFAPLASQLLAHTRLDAMLASFCASDAKSVAHRTNEAHRAPLHLPACGYCDLVTHAPTPPVIADNTLRHVSFHAPVRSAYTVEAPRLAPRNDAQPRAPPAFA